MASYKPPLSSRLSSGQLLLDFNERSSPLEEKILNKLKTWIDSSTTHVYPDYDGVLEKISEYTSAKPKNLFIGNGSDQLIDCVFRAILDSTGTVILPAPSFAMYRQLASLCECKIETYNLLAENPLDELKKACEKKPRMIVLCQPNNPTGQLLDLDFIDQLIKENPGTWFFIDEAYYEFSGMTQFEVSGICENLIITRTFSKAFGLAALRLGYMICSENLIEQCLKIRGPYDINQFSCEAAKIVLDHVEDIRNYCNEVMNHSKTLLEQKLKDLNINFIESSSNFILIRNELDLIDHFKRKGIRVRKMSQPELQESFRLSIGDKDALACTLDALNSYR